MTDPMHTPGFPQALRAVRSVGGVLLSHEAAVALTVAALATGGPLMRAAELDTIARFAREGAAEAASVSVDAAGALEAFAEMLAQAAQTVREALT